MCERVCACLGDVTDREKRKNFCQSRKYWQREAGNNSVYPESLKAKEYFDKVKEYEGIDLLGKNFYWGSWKYQKGPEGCNIQQQRFTRCYW